MSFFRSNKAIRNINYIKQKYNIAIFNNNLDEYIEDLNKRRTKYQLFYYFNNILRFLQSLSGIGITVLTTTNNPYINDYKEDINIYLWYLAIFTMLVNFTLESSDKCYDIKNNKIINELLKCESIKLKKKKLPYDDHTHPSHYNKISCFIKATYTIKTYNKSQPIVGLAELYDRSTSVPEESTTESQSSLPPVEPSTPAEPSINNFVQDNSVIQDINDELDDEVDDDDMSLYRRLLTLFS